MRNFLLVASAIALTACHSATPTPADVCAKLATAGVATNCHRYTPQRINARASDAYEFDLPSVPGHGGVVLTFAKDDDYTATVATYESMAMLTGPHRYGNQKARIFVQFNEEAPPDVGDKAKAIVAGL